MRKLAYLLLSGSFLGFAAVMLFGSVVEARPNYCATFIEKYSEVKEAKTSKCFICHIGTKSKKNRNDYGKAVGKALGAPKVAEKDKVEKALAEAESAKNKDGKAYGDLLKDGKLPEPIKKDDE